MTVIRNPDLEVDESRLANWNMPMRRRSSFRRLHQIQHRSMSARASFVLQLVPRHDPSLGDIPGLARLSTKPAFCGLAVAHRNAVVFESYAADFGPHALHSIQSITKTVTHLTIGQLIARGCIDPERPVSAYVAEAGPCYANATVRQLLDMDVANNFADSYDAPYTPMPQPGAPVGYARQEIAMGWRLPPAGEAEFGVRDFAASLHPMRREAGDFSTLYRSSNTDMLGWVAERASGIPWTEHIGAIVEAAGLEHALHIGLDYRGVPVLSGAGVMCLHDLLRYGLLLGRGGLGVNGMTVGSRDFLNDSMSGKGTSYRPGLKYRNQLVSNGIWAGHPGYAGQFLMFDPRKEAAAAIFSVVETPSGEEDGYFEEIMAVLSQLLERL